MSIQRTLLRKLTRFEKQVHVNQRTRISLRINFNITSEIHVTSFF